MNLELATGRGHSKGRCITNMKTSSEWANILANNLTNHQFTGTEHDRIGEIFLMARTEVSMDAISKVSEVKDWLDELIADPYPTVSKGSLMALQSKLKELL